MEFAALSQSIEPHYSTNGEDAHGIEEKGPIEDDKADGHIVSLDNSGD